MIEKEISHITIDNHFYFNKRLICIEKEERRKRRTLLTWLSWSNIILFLSIHNWRPVLIGIIFIKALLSFCLFSCRHRYHAIEITLTRCHYFSPAIEQNSRKWLSIRWIVETLRLTHSIWISLIKNDKNFTPCRSVNSRT